LRKRNLAVTFPPRFTDQGHVNLKLQDWRT